MSASRARVTDRPAVIIILFESEFCEREARLLMRGVMVTGEDVDKINAVVVW